MASGVEVICRECGQECTITAACAKRRNYICRACKAAQSRRSYAQQINPKTDHQWQPKAHDPNRPPAALLKEQRRLVALGQPLAGYGVDPSARL